MLPPKQLKIKDIPEVKEVFLVQQYHKCWLCAIDLSNVESRNICLDHDHKTGFIRGVLCRNCNSMEGKIFNCANRAKRDSTPIEFLKKLIIYWEEMPNGSLIHPSHKPKKPKRKK